MSARAPEDDRIDASLLALVPAILTTVWYWQATFSFLAPLRPSLLSVLVAVGAFAMSGRPLGIFKVDARRPVQLIVFIGVIAVLGGPFALVRGSAVTFVLQSFIPTLIVAVLVAARVRSLLSLRVVVDALLLGGMLYVWHFLRAPLDVYGKPLGDALPYYDANDGALLAVCCAVLSLGRISLCRSVLTKAFFLGLALLYLAVVVRSTSRGGFITLAATTIVVLVAVTSVPVKWRVGAVTVGAALVLAIGGDSYWAYMKTILKPQEDYNWVGNSDTGRMEIWKRGVASMASRPVLGVGAMNYGAMSGRSAWAKKMEMEGRGAQWNVAHNAYIEIGVELGIMGLICWLAIILGTISRLRVAAAGTGNRPERAMQQFVMAALCAFMVGSVLLSTQYWTFLYVLVALGTSLVVMSSRAPRDQRGAVRNHVRSHRAVTAAHALPGVR